MKSEKFSQIKPDWTKSRLIKVGFYEKEGTEVNGENEVWGEQGGIFIEMEGKVAK